MLSLSYRAARFKGFQQQDSQELLRYLLDGMRAEEVKVCIKYIYCGGYMLHEGIYIFKLVLNYEMTSVNTLHLGQQICMD